MHRLGAKAHERQLGKMHIEFARLGFRQDGHIVSGADLAQCQCGGKRLDPSMFNPVAQHRFLLLKAFIAYRP